MSNMNTSITWVDGKCLEDLDFTDNIMLLRSTPEKLQREYLAKTAGKQGSDLVMLKQISLKFSHRILTSHKKMKISRT